MKYKHAKAIVKTILLNDKKGLLNQVGFVKQQKASGEVKDATVKVLLASIEAIDQILIKYFK